MYELNLTAPVYDGDADDATEMVANWIGWLPMSITYQPTEPNEISMLFLLRGPFAEACILIDELRRMNLILSGTIHPVQSVCSPALIALHQKAQRNRR